MTVCIAATCDANYAKPSEPPKIVLCTDLMGSGSLGNRLTVKYRAIANDWHCLTAGIDDEINAIIPKLIKQLAVQRHIDETNIIPTFQAALKERKIEKSDEIILGKWGLSFEEFRRKRLQFPDDLYHRDMDEIAKMSLDAEFIIAGFDTIGSATLLQIDSAWGVKLREDFAVAGEGAYIAQSVMLHRNHNSISTKAQTLYCVYEAKRYAERVPSVGKHTYLVVYKSGDKGQEVLPEGIAFLDERFKKYGPQELVLQELDAILNPQFFIPAID
jgi:hypothetical protein